MTYDCFSFFNELDLLELRLETLAGVVDKFVLVESTKTHTNQDKPLHFADNAARFDKFKDKIIHVVVRDNPDSPDAWARERFQRDSIRCGLTEAQPNDTVLISDLDEIPNPEQVGRLGVLNSIAVFEQLNCYYFLNTTNGYWYGTRGLSAKSLNDSTPSQVRQMTGRIVARGGWHFSFIGGADAILRKLTAFAHQEYNTAQYTDIARVEAAIATGADLFSRGGKRAKLLANSTLPDPIRTHPDQYRQHLAREIIDAPKFHEDWYNIGKLRALMATYQHVKCLQGRVIEIGCWEGRSASYLACEANPDILHAVDTWTGNIDESADHPTAIAAQQRDVYRTFLRNMFVLTPGNFQAHRMHSTEYLKSDQSPVKFCHIDASHDYESVKAEIGRLLPLVVAGGILCGVDFESADVSGLKGGVERAVRELLPGYRNDGNFWWWRKDSATPALGGLAVRLGRRVAPKQLKRNFSSWLQARFPGAFASLQDWWWKKQARKRMAQRAAEESTRAAK